MCLGVHYGPYESTGNNCDEVLGITSCNFFLSDGVEVRSRFSKENKLLKIMHIE